MRKTTTIISQQNPVKAFGARTKIIRPSWDYLSTGFDGIMDYVDVGDANEFSFGNGVSDNPFTISMWIKPTQFNIARWWINKRGSAGINEEWQFLSTSTGQPNIVLFSQGSNTDFLRVFTTETLQLNVFSNVVMTYGGNGTSGDIEIYINRVAGTKNIADVGTYVAMQNTTANMRIACPAWAVQNVFAGVLSEISLWDVKFAQSDVDELFNDRLYGKPKDLNFHSKIGNLKYWNRMGEGATYNGSVWSFPDDSSFNNVATSSTSMGINNVTKVKV